MWVLVLHYCNVGYASCISFPSVLEVEQRRCILIIEWLTYTTCIKVLHSWASLLVEKEEREGFIV